MSSSKSVSIATWRRYIWRIGLPESQISLLLRLPLALTYPNSPEHQVWNIRSRSEWQGWPLTFTLLLSYFHIFTVLLSHFHFHTFILQNTKYDTLAAALGEQDGLAVLGSFYEVNISAFVSRYSITKTLSYIQPIFCEFMFWTEINERFLQVSQDDNPYLENIIDICSNITQVGGGFVAAKISMYYLSMHWYVIHCNVLHIKYLHITY